MTLENINSKLEEYYNSSSLLMDKVRNLIKPMMEYKPDDEKWTIMEHLIHIVDMELNGYLRYRMILAQPNENVMVLDEEKWANILTTDHSSINDYIIIFQTIRKIIYIHLKTIQDMGQWTENFIIHPQAGKINLMEWLNIYTNHLYEHLNYIDRNMKLWLESHDEH